MNISGVAPFFDLQDFFNQTDTVGFPAPGKIRYLIIKLESGIQDRWILELCGSQWEFPNNQIDALHVPFTWQGSYDYTAVAANPYEWPYLYAMYKEGVTNTVGQPHCLPAAIDNADPAEWIQLMLHPAGSSMVDVIVRLDLLAGSPSTWEVVAALYNETGALLADYYWVDSLTNLQDYLSTSAVFQLNADVGAFVTIGVWIVSNPQGATFGPQFGCGAQANGPMEVDYDRTSQSNDFPDSGAGFVVTNSTWYDDLMFETATSADVDRFFVPLSGFGAQDLYAIQNWSHLRIDFHTQWGSSFRMSVNYGGIIRACEEGHSFAFEVQLPFPYVEIVIEQSSFGFPIHFSTFPNDHYWIRFTWWKVALPFDDYYSEGIESTDWGNSMTGFFLLPHGAAMGGMLCENDTDQVWDFAGTGPEYGLDRYFNTREWLNITFIVWGAPAHVLIKSWGPVGHAYVETYYDGVTANNTLITLTAQHTAYANDGSSYWQVLEVLISWDEDVDPSTTVYWSVLIQSL
jgi:hypothetical protein